MKTFRIVRLSEAVDPVLRTKRVRAIVKANDRAWRSTRPGDHMLHKWGGKPSMKIRLQRAQVKHSGGDAAARRRVKINQGFADLSGAGTERRFVAKWNKSVAKNKYSPSDRLSASSAYSILARAKSAPKPNLP